MTNQEWYEMFFKVAEKGARPPIDVEKLREFKIKVNSLCEEYNLTLCHEDCGGAFFVVSGYETEIMRWFMACNDKNSVAEKRLAEFEWSKEVI